MMQEHSLKRLAIHKKKSINSNLNHFKNMTTENKYTSSIITKYGDTENVKTDSKIVREILERQGSNLLVDVIAEHVGQTVLKFNLNSVESERILNSLITELKEAILERI